MGGAAVLPVAYLVLRTLGSSSETWALLLRARTLAIAWRSLALVASVTAGTVLLALPLAWLTTRTDLPLRRWWAVLTALPLVIPSYVGSFLVVVALGPKGLVQRLLEPLGVERLPEIYGFPGAFFVMTLLTYPYVLLPVRAALLRLDPALEEAGRSLGRRPWMVFRTVVLPQLRPAIVAGASLVALYTLGEFGAVSILRYETFTWAIYLQYESAYDRTTAGALAMVLAMVALLLVGMAFRLRRGSYHRSTPGTARPVTVYRLGGWRLPALLFCSLVVLTAVVLPVAVLLYWAVRGVVDGSSVVELGPVVLNSVYVGGLAAVATLIAAWPVALLSARSPGSFQAALERVSYVGFALPGIVVALALIYFGANVVHPVYQTAGLLVLGYVILFLPTAVGSLRAALVQVTPQVEEVARSLGRRPWQVLWSITLPAVRPGVMASLGMVFLLTLKELPATLMLSPPGFSTLATSTWQWVTEAFFARAALPALLLIAASSLSLGLILRQEGGRAA